MNVGRVIGGRYRLLRQVGEGAMAAIWEAEHQTLGRAVAVKFLHAVGPPQSEASQRFVREARVAAAIKHRNVVDIIDFGLTDDDHRPYMVMELLEGRTLSSHLEERTRLSIAEAARITSDVLRGLAAVHDAGIVHRDLKPDNIFLVNDEDGPFPKLLDFGLSRRVGRGDMTAEGIILGTPDYMSPEQAKGQRHIDQRTDIYSMGVILYELVTGHMPFDGGTLAELLTRVIEGKYVPLDKRLPDPPPLLVDIVARAMNKDRNERYANAREMRAALATANLAPFAQNESGLMVVEPGSTPSFPGRTASGAGQLGPNPPSGVFSEGGARGNKTTLDGEDDVAPIDASIDDELTELDPAGDTSFDGPTRAMVAPPERPSPIEPPASKHTAAAYAHTVPSSPAVVLPDAQRPPVRKRGDDSAGVFTVQAAEPPPRRGGGIVLAVIVIAVASVAGGVLVHWAQTGRIPTLATIGLAPSEPVVPPTPVAPDAAPAIADASAEDAGMVAIESAPSSADASMDAGVPAADAAMATDAAADDAGAFGDGAAGDADAGIDDAGTEEEPRGRRRGRVRRRRPARRR